jgi:hypothetical protein
MVQVVFDFLTTIIGDIPINETITLMQLSSYIIVVALCIFLISPVFYMFKQLNERGKR